MAGRASKAGRTKARRLREQYGLGLDGPVPDLLELVEERVGVPVAIFGGLDELAGAYVCRGERRLILLNGDDHPVRLRFTLAHELAHHLFHDDAQPDTHAGLAVPGHWIEVRANHFAAELLLPEESLEDAEDLRDVVACAARHGVSAAAAAFRLADCGRLAAPEEVQAAIATGAHLPLAEAHEPFRDSLVQALESLPRIPAALRGSVLFRAGLGELPLEAAAAQIGHAPERLADALDAAGVPLP